MKRVTITIDNDKDLKLITELAKQIGAHVDKIDTDDTLSKEEFLADIKKSLKGVDLVVVPQTKPDKDADKLVSDFIKKDKLKRKKV